MLLTDDGEQLELRDQPNMYLQLDKPLDSDELKPDSNLHSSANNKPQQKKNILWIMIGGGLMIMIISIVLG